MENIRNKTNEIACSYLDEVYKSSAEFMELEECKKSTKEKALNTYKKKIKNIENDYYTSTSSYLSRIEKRYNEIDYNIQNNKHKIISNIDEIKEKLKISENSKLHLGKNTYGLKISDDQDKLYTKEEVNEKIKRLEYSIENSGMIHPIIYFILFIFVMYYFSSFYYAATVTTTVVLIIYGSVALTKTENKKKLEILKAIAAKKVTKSFSYSLTKQISKHKDKLFDLQQDLQRNISKMGTQSANKNELFWKEQTRLIKREKATLILQ